MMDDVRDKTVIYMVTNESIDAVVRGLDIKRNDHVLAVCGAGDQAIAMLEVADRIVAVDTSSAQIEYAKRRLGLISTGSFREFMTTFSVHEFGKDNAYDIKHYFEQPGRLEKIKENAHRMEFYRGDIFKHPSGGRMFSKIYLSNALGFPKSTGPVASAQQFAQIVPSLTHNGLIYIANMDSIRGQLRYAMEFLSEDEELTEKARICEQKKHWTPAVLRKILPWHE